MQDSYAKQFIEDARRAVRCAWCGRDKNLNTKSLCRHCNGVRKDLQRREKLKPQTSAEKWYLELAQEKKQSCVGWGQMLRGILNARVSGLDLERWFSMMARSVAGDDRIHRSAATMLGWTFTAEQRQVLAYMFWEVFSAQASRHRQSKAIGSIHRRGR
jgi:hypothetical protein